MCSFALTHFVQMHVYFFNRYLSWDFLYLYHELFSHFACGGRTRNVLFCPLSFECWHCPWLILWKSDVMHYEIVKRFKLLHPYSGCGWNDWIRVIHTQPVSETFYGKGDRQTDNMQQCIKRDGFNNKISKVLFGFITSILSFIFRKETTSNTLQGKQERVIEYWTECNWKQERHCA